MSAFAAARKGLNMLTSAKRILLAGCLLLAGAAVLLFVLENPQRIHLVFFGAASAELPIASLMMISFILGLLTCLPFSLWVLGRWRMRVAQLRRELVVLTRQSGQER